MTQDSTIKAQMRQLIQILAKHNHAYYVMDQPTIEDSEYDQFPESDGAHSFPRTPQAAG